MPIKLTTLIDNSPGKDLQEEHGLSLFIETGNLSILFDTGQSGNFADNAVKLGINLEKTDFVVISHGHYDHGGGLPAFFENNSEAPVYIHTAAARPVYFSKKSNNAENYIGLENSVFMENKDRFVFINDETVPAEGIHILTAAKIENRKPIFDNSHFFIRDSSGDSNETFDHEIFIIIERESDIILFSGCSHNNILSIIKHSCRMFPEKKLSRVVGGFHLPDVENFSAGYLEAISRTARELGSYTAARFITGHCTGNKAKLILKKELGDNIDFFYTGKNFIL